MRYWLAAVVAALVSAAPALADPFLTPGLGAEVGGAAGARLADRVGAAGVGYNPASVHTGRAEVTAGYLWAKPSLYIERDANPSLDAYLGKGPAGDHDGEYHLVDFRARVAGLQQRQAERVPLQRGFFIGAVVPLAPAGATANTSFAFAAYVPQGKLATIDLAGESAPYFVDFQDRNQAASLSAGVAHDFGHGLTAGGGMVLDLIQAEVSARAYVPVKFSFTDVIVSDDLLVPEADIQPFAKAQVAPRLRPVAGIRFAPNETWAFALAYRDESRGRVEVDGRVVLASGVPGAAEMPFAADIETHFEPRRASAGALWRPHERLRLTADVAWVQWSHYRPPLAGYRASNLRAFAQGALAASGLSESGILGGCVDLGGPRLCFPDEATLLARIPDGVSVRYEFSGARDIVTPRFGASWQAAKQIDVMAGYGYRPSMEGAGGFKLTRVVTLYDVDGKDETTRSRVDTNILDNAQHNFAAGAAWRRDPLTISVAGLFTQLVEKRTAKENNGVTYTDQSTSVGSQVTAFGYPGYVYGGHVVGGMLQAALRF